MDVFYCDPKFAAQMESAKSRRRAFGAERAKKLEARRAQLDAADTLADLRRVPGNWHELTGDWKGHLAVSLDGPYRLIFAPAEADYLTDRSLDWSTVSGVVLVGIVDYH